MTATSARNWFDAGGDAYARFRPAYPASLAAFLASAAPGPSATAAGRLAVDVGCGNGQLTRLLANHFEQVVGLDPSASQLASAAPDPRIDYRCAPAERLPLPHACASLVTAAQAAHWFDLPAFYAEVRRIAVPGAVLALVSYGRLELDPALDARFQTFYRDEIGPYWPPERRLVDTGYATLAFPFDEFTPPVLAIRLDWNLAELLGYVQTWSAVRQAREAGAADLLNAFGADLAAAWGDPERRHAVRWPINMRIGRC